MNTFTLRPSGRLSFGESKKTYKFQPAPRRSPGQRMRDESIGVIGASDFADLIGKPLASMDLSNLSNSIKTLEPAPAKRGLKGITGYGRQIVKDSAFWLQKEHGKERLAFWTVTIPPENLNESLIGQWSRVVDNTLQKLTYHLKKHDLPTFIVGVTEIQPKRYEREKGVPPLHLHIVFVAAHKPYQPCISKDTLAKLWADTIENFSGVHCRLDSVSSVQFVKKDVVGYLGKYMSKGFYQMDGLDLNLIPSSWYFCTKLLKSVVKSLVVKTSGEWVNDLYQYLRYQDALFNFAKPVKLRFADGGEIITGWYGELKGDKEYEHVWDLARNLRDTLELPVTV
jgi:hypothetical protein